jgi:glycosyltransferase involved in cell wall biosynthesis
VYLSHNHETTVGHHLAEAARGLRKLYKTFDAAKIARFERRLARAADLVTANTPEDCEKFSAMIDGRHVPFLPPGYGGRRVDLRRIGPHLPRRAVVVGSFDWPPKRLSIEAFLAAASEPFARAGIELQIVGNSDPAFLDGLRQRYPTVKFTGAVDDVRPYMAQARLALVPDQLGGFKLKSLDYVFNRLPVFAMDIAVPGTPMVDGSSIRLFPTHAALAQGVIDAIDDVEALNRQQELAFSVCADCFDWRTIGRRLVDHIRKARYGESASALARAS